MKFECGLGAATNIFTEVKDTTIIMNLARGGGLRSLNIYGDSKLVIDWMKSSKNKKDLNYRGAFSLQKNLRTPSLLYPFPTSTQYNHEFDIVSNQHT